VLIAIVKSRAHPAQNSLFFLQHQAVDLDCHGTILNASMVTEYRNRGVERTSRGSSGQLRCARSPGPSVPGAKAGLAWGFVCVPFRDFSLGFPRLPWWHLLVPMCFQRGIFPVGGVFNVRCCCGALCFQSGICALYVVCELG
jgi:hypothetical protein